MNLRFFFPVFLFCLLCSIAVDAQTLPVGLFESTEEAFRRQQLLVKDTTGVSYMVRPINVAPKKEGKMIIFPLPLVWKNQFNSHHPYGMNDGSMIASKGYQTQLSGGFFAKAGPVSIQFRPEVVYAENNDYTEIQERIHGDRFTLAYADFSNSIDLPSRVGDGPYSKFDWGQSNIRVTFDPVSVGLSNENLWWGPGSRSSLVMSNNAAGFKHLTLNTSKPVKTAIGSFEAQIIAGRLENSGVAKLEGELYTEKPDDWRYINAMIFTYQPKWVPGLFIGFDRSFVVYNKDMGNGFSDYLPIFSSGTKKNLDAVGPNGEHTEDQRKRDQYFSAFARWVLPESKAEIYGQFGRNDFPWDIRDALSEPEHSRAYIVGFKKLVSLIPKDTYIQFGVELTQMEGSNTGKIRAQPVWYKHRLVPAGYTNKGQVLGAGIGPDANLQSFEVSWINGLKRIGLRFENLTNNASLSSFDKKWWDLSFAGKFDWNWKDFLLSSQVAYVRSVNYQYADPGANNLQLQFGMLYDFK